MHIVLIGFGSRGDVQPLLALGKGLQTVGYTVSIAAGQNFQGMIEAAGIRYAPMRTDIQALMNSDVGQEWVESTNQMDEARNMRKMLEANSEDVSADLLAMAQDADVLVSGLPVFGVVQTIAQHLNKPHFTILFAPINPTRYHAATMVPMIGRDVALNRVSGYIGQYFTHWIFQTSTNAFRKSLGLPAWRFGDFTRAYNRDVPVLYGLSPHVIPQADDWPSHIVVTGYWFEDAAADWQPDPALVDFLEAGTPPIYLGFGSMTSRNPTSTVDMMLTALERTGQRGIIHRGWAGLEADTMPDYVFLVDYAPHEWLFPRMGGIIHHGGAGTTAAAFRAGVPQSVVPHMADQPYWGRRVHELGVGHAPIARKDFSLDGLVSMIEAMTQTPSMKANAAALSEKIRQEDGVTRAVEVLTQWIQEATS